MVYNDDDDNDYDEDAIIEAMMKGGILITKTKSPSEIDNSLTVSPIIKRRSIEVRGRNKHQQFPRWDKDIDIWSTRIHSKGQLRICWRY